MIQMKLALAAAPSSAGRRATAATATVAGCHHMHRRRPGYRGTSWQLQLLAVACCSWRVAVPAAAAVAQAAAAGGKAGAAAAGKTNVVILLADDLGFGDVGYNGGVAKTPNLDAMAASPHSLVFNRFYCGGAVCSPTRASILCAICSRLLSTLHLAVQCCGWLAGCASDVGNVPWLNHMWLPLIVCRTGRTPNRVCMWDYINLNTRMHLPHEEFTLGHAANAAGLASGHFGKWCAPGASSGAVLAARAGYKCNRQATPTRRR